MPDGKYTNDPAVTVLSGAEEMPITQGGVDKKVSPSAIATYIGAATTGTANRITVAAGVIDIAATYIGQASITTVGTIVAGTWSAKFAPRITTTATGATIAINADIQDIKFITALAANTTISVVGTPVADQELRIRIKDNNTPHTLTWDAGSFTFIGISAPTTTIAGQTMYLVFKYNAVISRWVCILNTDSSGGASALTQYYVGVGDVSNLLSGSANLQFDGNIFTVQSGADTGLVQLRSLAASGTYGAVYLGGVTAGSTNFSMISNASTTYVNGTTAVQFQINGLSGTYYMRITAGDVYIQTAKLHTDTGFSLASWGTSGVQVDFGAATYTDTSGAGTVANSVGYSFNQPTFASTNARTVTDAATVYIGNAPAAGTNTTLTNAYALWVDNGMSRFDGRINILSTTEQLRVQYDASNYYSTTVANNGLVTFNAVGSGSMFLFTDTVNIGTGIYNDGGGMKHARVTTGSVTGAATALITVTWTTAFPDTNYTVQASVLDSTTSSLSLSVVHIESITASAITVRVINNAVGALTGTLHVIAIHD